MRRKLLITRARVKNSLQKVYRLDDIDIISLDVFETLIIRPVASPNDLYEVMGWRMREILPAGMTGEDWKKIRYTAERTLRVKHFGREIKLSEIYDLLDDQFSPEFKQQAMEIECRTEEHVLQRVEHMRGEIEQARKAGKRIAFLSDMYLPEGVIRFLLERYGFYHKGDLLLVSSEHGAQKSTGKLFDVLMEKTGVPAKRIIHQGDNPWSDLAMAMGRGVRAQLFCKHEMNRYEHTIMGIRDVPYILRSIVAGTSRAVRLSIPEVTREHYRDVARRAGVTAPRKVAAALSSVRSLSELERYEQEGDTIVAAYKKIFAMMLSDYPEGLPVIAEYMSVITAALAKKY